MDPIADMLTIIRNALLAHLKDVKVPYSRVKFELARVLLEEGFINNFRTEAAPKKHLLIQLKYLDNGRPVIVGIKRLSKSSQRRYVGFDEIPKVLGGLGVTVLSTNKGIMTDRDARKDRLGGELICSVW